MEGIRSQFLFSEIFEREEDIQDNPFVFEKFELGAKKEAYKRTRIEGTLLKKRKAAKVSCSQIVYRPLMLVCVCIV